jgi:hypothetical protein
MYALGLCEEISNENYRNFFDSATINATIKYDRRERDHHRSYTHSHHRS